MRSGYSVCRVSVLRALLLALLLITFAPLTLLGNYFCKNKQSKWLYSVHISQQQRHLWLLFESSACFFSICADCDGERLFLTVCTSAGTPWAVLTAFNHSAPQHAIGHLPPPNHRTLGKICNFLHILRGKFAYFFPVCGY